MNRIIPLLVIIFLLFPAHDVFSQGIWKTYTRADGLAGDTVRCITQDKAGNMWFGTSGAGLSKLDSNGVWTNFMNTDSTVSIIDIEVDSLNNKWLTVALNGGVIFGQYVGKFSDTTLVALYDVRQVEAKPAFLGQDSLGQIWCGMTDYGLACWFDGIEWRLYGVIGTGIYSIVSEIKTDRLGKLYFAHERGISTLTYCPFYGVWVHDIAFDKQNRMWFTATWNLWMFDGKNFQNYSRGQDKYPEAVAIDSSNNIWTSYTDRPAGVSKFDGTKFTYFTHSDGLGADLVWDIFVDNQGDIWFATQGGGVSVLHDTTLTKVNQKENLSYKSELFSLYQNHPNPFNEITSIQYNLSISGIIIFTIYNLIGKEVRTLTNTYQSAGEHEINWDGTDNSGKELSSGIYLAVLTSDNLKESIKLTLIR